MIKQVLDRDFVLRHLNAFGKYLDQETQLQDSGDVGALERARQAGVTADDLRQAKAALVQAQGDQKASELRAGQQVFLPPHPTASALQSVLQRSLIERRPAMIGSPGELQPGDDPITDLSVTSGDTETLFEQF